MADAKPKPPTAARAPSDEAPIEAAAEAAAREAAGKGPGGDAAPKRKKRKKRIARKDTEAIERALVEILTLPAAPAAVRGELTNDDRYRWLAGHFGNRGPELAKQIALASEKNEVLRVWCERIIAGEAWGMLIVASIAYVYPVASFYGVAPTIPIPNPILGDPPPPPTPPTPPPNGNGAAAPGQHMPRDEGPAGPAGYVPGQEDNEVVDPTYTEQPEPDDIPDIPGLSADDLAELSADPELGPEPE